MVLVCLMHDPGQGFSASVADSCPAAWGHTDLWKTDWSQLKQSSTACITCFSVCLILKAVCLISISNVDRGNRNLSPSQTDLMVVLSRRELRVRLRSQSLPVLPAHTCPLQRQQCIGCFKEQSGRGFPRLFPLSWCQCPGADAVRKGQSCPVLGTAGSSQLYSVRSEGKRERNNAADTKVTEGEGRRHRSWHHPAACGRYHGGAGISHGTPYLGADMSRRKLTPVESPRGAFLPWSTRACGKEPC